MGRWGVRGGWVGEEERWGWGRWGVRGGWVGEEKRWGWGRWVLEVVG